MDKDDTVDWRLVAHEGQSEIKRLRACLETIRSVANPILTPDEERDRLSVIYLTASKALEPS